LYGGAEQLVQPGRVLRGFAAIFRPKRDGPGLAEWSGQGDNMKTTTSALLIISAFAFSTTAANAKGGDQVGAVVVKDQSVKFVAAGPAILHLYSMDRGGNVFTAAATTGTDADCVHAQAGTRDGQNEIRVDQRRILEVPAGQVACIAAASPRAYELLWHAHQTTTPRHETLVAQKQ
jgi:hypothetical protein